MGIGGGLLLGGLIIGGYLIKKAVNNYYIGRRVRNQAFNDLDPTDNNFHLNISNQFHQVLEDDPNFTWQAIPAGVGPPQMEAFLDSNVDSNPALACTCNQISAMLFHILSGDAPQNGIGLQAGMLQQQEYTGANGYGFFAAQNGEVLRSPRNVFTLAGLAQNFRYWGSHYVLLVTENGNTRIYDPSYGVEYVQIEDMSAADVTRLMNVTVNNINGVFVKRILQVTNQNNIQIAQHGDLSGYYLVCERDGQGLRHGTAPVADGVDRPMAFIGPIEWENQPDNLTGDQFAAQMPQGQQDQLANFQVQ